MAALIEGQAFAGGEFLFWANQLPEKILLEWIGPFLGGMRRLGTPSVARLELRVPPITESIFIPTGTEFQSDSNKSANGESVTFVTTRDYLISPGDLSIYLSVSSKYVGSKYNLPANSITRISDNILLQGTTITNPQPAVGGSDIETYEQVQQRFLTQIRRRNPVSQHDWQEFFIDLFGLGTITVVKPQQSGKYLNTRVRNPNATSFFVLGPGGVELTKEQLIRGQRILNFSTPVNSEGYLYPISLDEAYVQMSLEIAEYGRFISSRKEASRLFRDLLFATLTPGFTFPVDSSPSVGDVESAFNTSISSENRFKDPKVVSTVIYNNPVSLTPYVSTYSQIYTFEPREFLLNEKDLVSITDPTEKFYPVVSSFTPYSPSKKDQAQLGTIALRKIATLGAGSYEKGQVVSYLKDQGAGVRVILENVTLRTIADATALIASGKISALKVVSPWEEETTYQFDDDGVYNPEVVAYDYSAGEFIPNPTSESNLIYRPNGFIWVVNQNFTLGKSTNNLTGAQSEDLIGPSVVPKEFKLGVSYTAGEWVYTPNIGSGPFEVDEYYHYVDNSLGHVKKYAYVETDFTFSDSTIKVKDSFDSLVESGTLTEVVVRPGDGGISPYLYKPRFETGDYLEYRSNSSANPEYYIATIPFTPSSTNVEDLLEEGVILPVASNTDNYMAYTSGFSSGQYNKPRRMFTFFKGDQTLFREGSNITVYVAKANVTPVFEFQVYLDNGVFEELKNSGSEAITYVSFFKPEYKDRVEDIVIDSKNKNFYRVMRAFSPPVTQASPTGAIAPSTERIEEFNGNLKRIVRKFECTDNIESNLGDISALKMGIADITISLANHREDRESFIWENTELAQEEPDLFWNGKNRPKRLDYGEGTLAL